MERIEKTKVVSYTPEQMFDLVDNVPMYPEFVPFCVESNERARTEHSVEASLTVAKGPISQSFTTKNTLKRPQEITLDLVDGPFKSLQGRWRFDPVDDHQTKVSLVVEFTFSNFLLKKAFGPIFHLIASQMVDAFCDRAKTIYG